jgi:hypothetical protein
MDTENNLFLRRLHLMAGGKLGKQVAGANPITDLFLQDAYASYAFHPEFQLNGGMMIIPLSHNSGQSATSLLAMGANGVRRIST